MMSKYQNPTKLIEFDGPPNLEIYGISVVCAQLEALSRPDSLLQIFPLQNG